MQVAIIPNLIGAFGTVTKGLLKGLEDGWRPSKRQHYWERPEYWEESGRLEDTCCHSDSSEKPSANADGKSSNEWIKLIIILENFTRQELEMATKWKPLEINWIPSNSSEKTP